MRVLGVVEVVGLGGREEDAFDAFAEEKLRKERVPARAEGRQDVGHGEAEVVDRAGAGVDRAKGIDEDDLPVDPGEVVAEVNDPAPSGF